MHHRVIFYLLLFNNLNILSCHSEVSPLQQSFKLPSYSFLMSLSQIHDGYLILSQTSVWKQGMTFFNRQTINRLDGLYYRKAPDTPGVTSET